MILRRAIIKFITFPTDLESVSNIFDNFVFKLQIRRIKEDVEYYIESSQDPDFEENEYIYDDIIGLDEVELSGVGLPSSATTDSNNSNETGGTPTSLTSGASPVPSPSHSAPLHNHSSDSSTESADKKKKDDLPKVHNCYFTLFTRVESYYKSRNRNFSILLQK